MFVSKNKPRPVSNLIVIEEDSKRDALARALAESGMSDFHIFYVPPRLYAMPKSTLYSGIDTGLSECGRYITDQSVVDLLLQWAENADRVLLATEPNQEGDALAADLASLLVTHRSVGRARLRCLDLDGVTSAFSNIEPVRKKDGWPMLARRILDRVIECAFVDRMRDPSHRLTASRAAFSVLSIAASKSIPKVEVTLALAAEDGGDPFICRLPVPTRDFVSVKSLVLQSLEFAKNGQNVRVGKSSPAPQSFPWSYGSALLAIASATGRDVADVAASLTRLYQAGKISYPWSTSESVSAEGLAVVGSIAAAGGARLDPKRFKIFTRSAKHAHEAVRPLAVEVNIGKPMGLLDPDLYVLSLITRNIISCGLPFLLSKPDEESLPEWARGLKFSRLICQRVRPWGVRVETTRVREVEQCESLLKLIVSNGISRPTEWISLIQDIEKAQLFSEHMELSEVGRSWLERIPASLLNVDTAKSVDAIIDGYALQSENAEEPRDAINRILDHLDLSERAARILEARAGVAQGIN